MTFWFIGIISYPASVMKPDGSFDTRDEMWSYQLFRGDIGDYAIVNEGAEPWYSRYREAADDICMLASFQGRLPEDMPKAAAGPDISLWQKNIQPEDLESPSLRIAEITEETAPDGIQGTIHLNPRFLTSFLSELRSLEDGDIQDLKYQQRSTLPQLMTTEGENETVAALQLPLKDLRQILVLVYRYRGDLDRSDLGFYITGQYEELMKDPLTKVAFNEYRLENPMLALAAEKLVTQLWNQQ